MTPWWVASVLIAPRDRLRGERVGHGETPEAALADLRADLAHRKEVPLSKPHVVRGHQRGAS